MSLVWNRAFDPAYDNHPTGIWFSSETLAGLIALAPGLYEYYKIPAGGGHNIQLVFRSPVDRVAGFPWALSVRAGVIYILTYPDDTPNWGTETGLIAISPPCGNWSSLLFEAVELIRNQTSAIQAAVSKDITLSTGMLAAVAETKTLEIGMVAYCAADMLMQCGQYAAVEGESDTSTILNAAVSDEISLSSELVAAVSTDFGVTSEIRALIQKEFTEYVWIKAAIIGEPAPITCALRARVLADRRDQIRLEFEPMWIQDLVNSNAPNSPSVPRDSRVQVLGGG